MKKASESIFITQPSLTKSIKILEEAIGSPLFVRLPRGVKLTKEGVLLLKFCHDLFASITDMEQKLAFPDDPMAGSLRVGTYDSIGIYFWPNFLKSFLPKYPRLNFEMSTGRSTEMQSGLERNELDLILVIEPKVSAQTTVEIFKKDTFKFYSSTKGKKVYSNQDEAPLILMPSALAGTQPLNEVLASLGLGQRKLYTTSSLESVKELTLNGIGIGLLPQMVAQASIKSKNLKEVKLSNIPKQGIGEHRIGIAYQNARKDSPLIKVLIEELKKHKW